MTLTLIVAKPPLRSPAVGSGISTPSKLSARQEPGGVENPMEPQ
jgi:hypothetical protein